MSDTTPRCVGRGPVPRHAAIRPSVVCDRQIANKQGKIGRSCTTETSVVCDRLNRKQTRDMSDTTPRFVGRGPVPRHAAVPASVVCDRLIARKQVKIRRSLPTETNDQKEASATALKLPVEMSSFVGLAILPPSIPLGCPRHHTQRQGCRADLRAE